MSTGNVRVTDQEGLVRRQTPVQREAVPVVNVPVQREPVPVQPAVRTQQTPVRQQQRRNVPQTLQRQLTTRMIPRVLVGMIIAGLSLLAIPYLLPSPHNSSAASLLPWTHGWCPPQPVTSRYATGKVLLVATSQKKLGWTQIPTGVWLEELTEAYYEFAEAGWEIEIASPRGGRIPIEPQSNWWITRSHTDARALKDPVFLNKFSNSTPLCDVQNRALDFDVVYIAGGTGAGFDLFNAECLPEIVSDVYANHGAVGGVCHGTLGLIHAVDKATGLPLLQDKPCTGVTNKQMRLAFGMHYLTPYAPEDELKKLGCGFMANKESWTDFTATEIARSGRIVTGQNQKSACFVARELLFISRYQFEKEVLKQRYGHEENIGGRYVHGYNTEQKLSNVA